MASTISAGTTSGTAIAIAGDTSGALALQTNNGTTAVTIDTSQNVGIGTSPSYALDVRSTSAPAIRLSRSGTAGQIASMVFEDGNATLGSGSTTRVASDAGAMSFSTGGTSGAVTGGSERMRITSGGDLCVGLTSAPMGTTAGSISNNVAVANNTFWTRNSSATPYGMEVQYSGAAPNNTGNPYLECFDTGATRFVMRSNGGLANYQANNANLSDAREKENIKLAGNYLNKICAIPVKTFNYIDQNREEDDGLTLGVIAQEVQAIAPELVLESNWGAKGEPEKMRLSIYQTDLQYALMKCIQELNAKVEAQALEIQALKGVA
jgi:hypothetical protein